MMTFTFFIYRSLVYPIFVLCFLFIALFHKKTRLGLSLRLSALKSRSPISGSCIWIHAASGEYEYAKPLVRELKNQHPHDKILVTYFSPSYEKQIQADPHVDYIEALPLDMPGPIQSFLKHYKPKCLVIARTDLWPELLNQCKKNEIPVALISAKSPANIQMNWPHRTWRGFLFRFISRIYTVSDQDASYFKKIDSKLLTINTGDTRYDQVIYRLKHTNKDQLPKINTNSLLLCAGSTWPEDENKIIPALSERVQSNQIHLLVAPHEPTEKNIQRLIKLCKKHQLSTQRLSELSTWDSQVLIIDKIGVLASFYSICHIAFIGGSFRAKVHSVMEALAAGLPCLVGPYFHNNPEAIEFSQLSFSEGDLPHAVHTASNIEQVKSWAKTLIEHQNQAPEWRKNIQSKIQSRSGATRQVLQHMTDWIDP